MSRCFTSDVIIPPHPEIQFELSSRMDAYGIRGFTSRHGDSELLRALQPSTSSSSRRAATGLPSRNAQTPIPPSSHSHSGGSSSSSSRAHAPDSSFHALPGSNSPPVVGRKIIDRNRKPCGSCSSSKRKVSLSLTYLRILLCLMIGYL